VFYLDSEWPVDDRGMVMYVTTQENRGYDFESLPSTKRSSSSSYSRTKDARSLRTLLERPSSHVPAATRFARRQPQTQHSNPETHEPETRGSSSDAPLEAIRDIWSSATQCLITAVNELT